MATRPWRDALREDCMLAGEMVQLANVTRDIEKDLRRGVADHPALKADLGRSTVMTQTSRSAFAASGKSSWCAP